MFFFLSLNRSIFNTSQIWFEFGKTSKFQKYQCIENMFKIFIFICISVFFTFFIITTLSYPHILHRRLYLYTAQFHIHQYSLFFRWGGLDFRGGGEIFKFYLKKFKGCLINRGQIMNWANKWLLRSKLKNTK